MKIKYIYSACIEIDCGGFKILTDPWFTDGAYDGSWYHFPKIDPFKFISKPDLIYISHIHPDHYDPVFLTKLFERFGQINILIPDLNPNYLLFKGKSDGFDLIPTREFENDYVKIFIEENDTGSLSDIDSALIVKDKQTEKVLLNLNDCIYNQPHVDKLTGILDDLGGNLDFLALGYTGAGPYPQTYIDPINDKELLESEAKNKKLKFFERYLKFIETFKAGTNLPFAGEYMLGSRLVHLNKFRGVADAFEIKNIDEKAIVLSNGGTYNLVTEEINNERSSLYDEESVQNRIKEIESNKLDYEIEINLPFEKINFMRLLKSAAQKAASKSEISDNYSFIFSLVDGESLRARFLVKTEESSVTPMQLNEEITLENFSEIIIDYRYFYGLLTSIYHWNNAEVGSMYLTRRVPLDNFNESVQNYLNFLATC